MMLSDFFQESPKKYARRKRRNRRKLLRVEPNGQTELTNESHSPPERLPVGPPCHCDPVAQPLHSADLNSLPREQIRSLPTNLPSAHHPPQAKENVSSFAKVPNYARQLSRPVPLPVPVCVGPVKPSYDHIWNTHGQEKQTVSFKHYSYTSNRIPNKKMVEAINHVEVETECIDAESLASGTAATINATVNEVFNKLTFALVLHQIYLDAFGVEVDTWTKTCVTLTLSAVGNCVVAQTPHSCLHELLTAVSRLIKPTQPIQKSHMHAIQSCASVGLSATLYMPPQSSVSNNAHERRIKASRVSQFRIGIQPTQPLQEPFSSFSKSVVLCPVPLSTSSISSLSQRTARHQGALQTSIWAVDIEVGVWLNLIAELSDPTPLNRYVHMKKLCTTRLGQCHIVQEPLAKQLRCLKWSTHRRTDDDVDPIQRHKEAEILHFLFTSEPHPNICRYYASYRSANQQVLVMEYLAGVSMDTWLCDIVATQDHNAFAPAYHCLIRRIMFRLIQAIQFLHSKRVAHLDICPENIILVDGVVGLAPKLIDFGRARRNAYSLPVGFRKRFDDPSVSGRWWDGFQSDVYHLGVVLMCLLTADLPWVTQQINNANREGSPTHLLELPGGRHAHSEPAIDIMRRMLSPITERWTPDQLLQHTWFKNLRTCSEPALL